MTYFLMADHLHRSVVIIQSKILVVITILEPANLRRVDNIDGEPSLIAKGVIYITHVSIL